MSSRVLTISWIGSVLLVSVMAGTSWFDVLLSSDAGGQALQISGYLTFPIISALILVQAAALLVSLLTPTVVGRVIAGILIPIQIWHLITVVLSYEATIVTALESEVAGVTGVVGDGQLQLIASSFETTWFFGYLVAIVLNIGILAARATSRFEQGKTRVVPESDDDTASLWESQK